MQAFVPWIAAALLLATVCVGAFWLYVWFMTHRD